MLDKVGVAVPNLDFWTFPLGSLVNLVLKEVAPSGVIMLASS